MSTTATGIQWTDATWNPIRGCSRVSDGCRNCYAEQIAARFSGPGLAYEGLARRRSNGEPQWTGVVRVVESAMQQPLSWRKPRRIFVNSMSDLFHENVSDETIDRIFAVMANAKQHTFQILTKRADRMREYLSAPGRIEDIYVQWSSVSGAPEETATWPLPNVWLGVSVENQAAADERIPLLLETPAAVRFLSCEPLLGPLDLEGHMAFDRFPGGFSHAAPVELLNWIIVGGESGRNARGFDLVWAREIVAQCSRSGVACFVKQLGADPYDSDLTQSGASETVRLRDSHGGDWSEWPADMRVRQFPVSASDTERGETT